MRPDARELETVAGYALMIATAQPSAEAQQRWVQRAECLAQWLMETWQRESRQAGGARRVPIAGAQESSNRSPAEVST